VRSGLTTQARRFDLLWWALRISHLALKSTNRIRRLLRFCKVKLTVISFNFLGLVVTDSLAIPLANSAGSGLSFYGRFAPHIIAVEISWRFD